VTDRTTPPILNVPQSPRILKFLGFFLASLLLPELSHGQTAANVVTVENIAPDNSGNSAKPAKPLRQAKPADFNEDIYYRNKFEFSQELGVLPINIPFVFDVFVGGDYSQKPLHYTLIPVFPSLRWHMGGIAGPGILRGNTDFTCTLSYTDIPRGPETRYFAWDLGVRRNFVHRSWHSAPYFEYRLGMGNINAKEPDHINYAQGQDLTFTMMVGTGVRYNFNPKYSLEIGATYMHVSNAYLSEPKYIDNGINVVGPLVGFNVRLGRPKHKSRAT
jgi:hypothetical protein